MRFTAVLLRMIFGEKEVRLASDDCLCWGERAHQFWQPQRESRDRSVLVAGANELRAKFGEQLARTHRTPLEQLSQKRYLQSSCCEFWPPLRLCRRVRHSRALCSGCPTRNNARRLEGTRSHRCRSLLVWHCCSSRGVRISCFVRLVRRRLTGSARSRSGFAVVFVGISWNNRNAVLYSYLI